ncbi:hypothetical protein CLOBY_17880 [Clostridium saccharobutylicum]|uniref:hypothetical protein n=1 Tax=Clostridium saccharobutylicum TaxID=169679 RepID=UPI000983B584|nr:hypothetical protein [Clostridium saccharobutylicum]AQS09657.1 hypothetical protein CLOBY_17880 [Clostridium saccharobutylicum]MBC2438819.1 hypothetical protein [Clostridium saccharobutylicum]NSB91088.1 hypothetical protein [Clostridium saccharobutylicum]NYC27954.1 hypothetical protein [Clostridium saccharobutylicum]OOM12966.1 hypothetical protein CLSAB_36570 [Clostridium saccharobutylicum]
MQKLTDKLVKIINGKGWGFSINVLNKETTKEIDYTDLLCWLEYNREDDLILTTAKEYKRFIESEDEDDEMDMRVTNTEQIYNEGIFGIDIYEEENFISARATENENDILLTIKWGTKERDYVLLYS